MVRQSLLCLMLWASDLGFAEGIVRGLFLHPRWKNSSSLHLLTISATETEWTSQTQIASPYGLPQSTVPAAIETRNSSVFNPTSVNPTFLSHGPATIVTSGITGYSSPFQSTTTGEAETHTTSVVAPQSLSSLSSPGLTFQSLPEISSSATTTIPGELPGSSHPWSSLTTSTTTSTKIPSTSVTELSPVTGGNTLTTSAESSAVDPMFPPVILPTSVVSPALPMSTGDESILTSILMTSASSPEPTFAVVTSIETISDPATIGTSVSTTIPSASTRPVAWPPLTTSGLPSSSISPPFTTHSTFPSQFSAASSTSERGLEMPAMYTFLMTSNITPAMPNTTVFPLPTTMGTSSSNRNQSSLTKYSQSFRSTMSLTWPQEFSFITPTETRVISPSETSTGDSNGSGTITTAAATSSIRGESPAGLDDASVSSTVSAKSAAIIGGAIAAAVCGGGMLFLYPICRRRIQARARKGTIWIGRPIPPTQTSYMGEMPVSRWSPD